MEGIGIRMGKEGKDVAGGAALLRNELYLLVQVMRYTYNSTFNSIGA